jgi:glycosyltransferase involved in cell wall biosynthesis
MKILLTINLPYFPTHGGANKSNRHLMEAFARNGHSVRVVAPALATPPRMTRAEVLEELRARGVAVTHEDGADVYELDGVEVYAVAEAARMRARLIDQIRGFGPDWVLVSSEDPSQNLLDAALKTRPGRVVYLARTAPFLPFGPNAFFPSPARTKLLEQAAAVVAVSDYVAGYIRRWGGIEAVAVPISFYGSGPFPNLGRFDEGFVTMINPCAVKGISIFLALARELPDVQFAAVPTWGTTEADLRALRQLPNVRLLEPTENIDEIYGRSRVVLVPSVVAEGKSRVILEAMSRGIPVLASDAGGNAEAKLGTDFLLPVRLIERFGEELDGNMLPVPEVPEQEIGPWLDALRRLLSDRELYERHAAQAREAALNYVAGTGVAPLQDFLLRLAARPERTAPPAKAHEAAPPQSAQAAAVGAHEGVAGLTPQQQALLTLRLRKKSAGRADHPSRALRIERVPRDAELRCSFAQERLWFLDQMKPGDSFYNMCSPVRLKGPLDPRVLERSLNEVIRRHETLRTRFSTVKGYPVQVIAPFEPARLPVTDLSGMPEAEREEEARRLAREDEREGFDLARGPLMRVGVLRLSDDDHVLLLTMHHIISDAWSMNVFVRDLSMYYLAFAAGKEPQLTELPIQYADFAAWQRYGLHAEAVKAQFTYWKQQLAGAPALLNLPTDRPRPTARTYLSHGAIRSFRLSPEVSMQLQSLGQRESVTAFIVQLAAFSTLLCRYSAQEDVIVGCNIANRNRSETEGLIGFFINMLPLRTNFSGNPTFREILQRVREVSLGAFTHQDFPFERMIAEVTPDRDPGRMPLVQVIFDFQPNRPLSQHVGPVELHRFPSGSAPKNFDMIDMTLHMENAGNRLYGELIYSTDLYNEASIVRLVQNFELLLAGVAANPDIRLGELKQLLEEADRRHHLARQEEFKQAKRGTLRNVKPRAVSVPDTKGESRHDQTTS